MHDASRVEGLRSAGLAIIALGVAITGLVYGRSLLVPLALAIFIWAALEAAIKGFSNIRLGGYAISRGLATFLGLSSMLLGLYLIVSVLLGQVDALGAAWPRYAARFETIINSLTQWLSPEQSDKFRQMVAEIDIARRIPGLLATTQSLVVTVLIVLAYVGFLFAERGYVAGKIAAMFPDAARAQEATALFETISRTFQRYIWIKTVVSVLTGALSYVIMRWLEIDFAETWALLIFALNYIPNIGSIIAVAFPALIALVQFETPTNFLILVTTLTLVQVAIGSVLEPLLMGKSLNMSPLAILLSLAFWGTLWGVPGMFLSVPILVVVMIVCANIPSWRWFAVLLSKDGHTLS